MRQPPWKRRPFHRILDALSKRAKAQDPPPPETPPRLPEPSREGDVERKKAGLRAALSGAASPASPVPSPAGRPALRKGALVALAMLLITANLFMLFRGWEPPRWLPVSVDFEGEARRFEAWERRGSALSYLTAEDREVSDKAAASAVAGGEKIPLESLQVPALPGGGLEGILSPDEGPRLRRKGAVEGLDLGRFLSRAPPSTGAILLKKTEKDRFTPYRTTDSPRTARGSPQAGVSLGRAGENLDNFAEPTNRVKADEGYLGAAGAGKFQKVPEGLSGPELVMAMLDDQLLASLNAYAKEGKWRMRKVSGARQEVPPLDGDAMLSSEALGQLLETKRATDDSLECAECRVEERVHNNRATFYGERHDAR